MIEEPELSVSIVLYIAPPKQVAATLRTLERAVSKLQLGLPVKLFLIDNGSEGEGDYTGHSVNEKPLTIEYVAGHGNVGFGAGHNLVLRDICAFHLILNPDAELAEDSLVSALGFMQKHPKCGLLSPAATWDDGTRQYLCKRYPSLFDLFLRGFAPALIKRLFKRRLDRYEMRGVTESGVVWDPPIVSGCFMLFRREVLQALGGFDSRFFLYFEDLDLSLRAAKLTRLTYVPEVKIVHHGGHSARKGLRHVLMFARSAFQFFQKHGWRIV